MSDTNGNADAADSPKDEFDKAHENKPYYDIVY